MEELEREKTHGSFVATCPTPFRDFTCGPTNARCASGDKRRLLTEIQTFNGRGRLLIVQCET